MTPKHHLRASALILALAVSIAPPALAHHAAGPTNSGSGGPITIQSAETLARGDTVISFVSETGDYDSLDTSVIAAATEAGGEDAHVHSLDRIDTTALVAAYGVTNGFTVSARLPYVARKTIREGHLHEDGDAEIHDRGDSAGVGDISILGQWRLLGGVNGATHAALVLGVEAPTGQTRKRDLDGEVFDAEFQPGSDSWDVLAGFAFNRTHDRWRGDMGGLYTFAGDGLGANLGDRFSYGAAVSYRLRGAPAHRHPTGLLHTHGTAIDLMLEASGEWHGRQKDAGATDPNSGGHVVYVAPGARCTFGAASLFASVGVPVVNHYRGVQADAGVRGVVGVARRF